MKVEIFSSEDKFDYRMGLIIKINDRIVFSVVDGESEDNGLARNFNDCFKIGELIRRAHEAGQNGESFKLITKEVTWDEFCEI